MTTVDKKNDQFNLKMNDLHEKADGSIQYKIQTKEEGITRLDALAKKIDELIAIEEDMMPEGADVHVMTNKEIIKGFINQEGRYIKFGLIYNSTLLPDF